MAITEEPILSRLDRLDNMLRQLEEIRSCGNGNRSPKSLSCASTPSSGTLTSEGQASSVDFSPKSSLEKHCRPIVDVVMETGVKGTLVERLDHLEDRVLKFEEELEAERSSEKKMEGRKKKGLRQFVKQIVGGKSKHKKGTDSDKDEAKTRHLC